MKKLKFFPSIFVKNPDIIKIWGDKMTARLTEGSIYSKICSQTIIKQTKKERAAYEKRCRELREEALMEVFKPLVAKFGTIYDSSGKDITREVSKHIREELDIFKEINFYED